ncbi:hypothetical protein ACNOYE_33345 [Nannocystaceae bacterium ST9]
MADEAKLLLAVDQALRRGALDQAGDLLADHRRSFASGSLADQAEELELLLACAERESGASSRATRYLDAHPETLALARIEATCELP